jgi:predicted HTH domain antitoxin
MTFLVFHGKLAGGDPMALTIELPADVEQRLRTENPDIDAEVKEAMLVELYRQDKLSRYELSLALGLNRFETDAVLKKRRVTEDLPTPEELEEDLRRARELLNR